VVKRGTIDVYNTQRVIIKKTRKKVVRKERYNCCLQQTWKKDITKKTKKKVVKKNKIYLILITLRLNFME